jgi:replication factor A1
MGANKLIPSTVEKIYKGELKDPVHLQVIHLKGFELENNKPPGNASNAPSTSPLRYKIVLSDSAHFIQGTLATSLNHLFDSRMIDTYCVVRVSGYTVNDVKGHRILFVSGFDVADIDHLPNKVGVPVNIETALGGFATNIANGGASVPGGLATAQNPSSAPVSNNGNTNISNPAHSIPATKSNNNTTAAMPPTTPTKRAFGQVDKGAGLSKSELSELTALIQPINTLSPYNDRWVIKARVHGKTEIKKWANPRGEGKLFSCTLTDASGEIRMTAFKEACDKFFDIVENGRVYIISNAIVKISKRQFGSVKNDYEIHLENNSLIQQCEDSGDDAANLTHFDFVPIARIGQFDRDTFIDVIGVVKDVGSIQSITAKTTQKQLTKRDITLIDTSSSTIKLTLWSEQAESFPSTGGTLVMAVKGAKVSDYGGGRSLGTVSSSLIEYNNSSISQTKQLTDWFESEGKYISAPSTAAIGSATAASSIGDEERKTLASIKSENLGMSADKVILCVIQGRLFDGSRKHHIHKAGCPRFVSRLSKRKLQQKGE